MQGLDLLGPCPGSILAFCGWSLMVLKMWSPYTRGFRVSSKILSPKHRSFLLNTPAKENSSPLRRRKKQLSLKTQASSPYPKPQTLNPKPQTLNPRPQTLNRKDLWEVGSQAAASPAAPWRPSPLSGSKPCRGFRLGFRVQG